MTSLRTLLFLMGTALVSGSEVKINSFPYTPYTPYGFYQLPAELANQKTFSFGNIGIPNLGSGITNLQSLVPFPINGIAGYLPILARGEKADCDHSGYIISGQPAPLEPIYVPEAPKVFPASPEIIEKTKPLAPIPEAPVLPPFKVEEPAQTYVPYPTGEFYIETPEAPKIEEIKPLGPIPEAPILPPFALPELPLKVSVPEPSPAFYIEAPKALEVEETKPLAPTPEAPVLPPFSAPALVSYGPAPFYAPCEDSAYVPYPTGEFYVETPEAPKIEEIKPIGPIPEAPILPPFTLPELPLKVSVPEPAPAFYIEAPKAMEVEETKPLAPIPEAPVLPPFSAPAWVSYEPAPFYAPYEDSAYVPYPTGEFYVEKPEAPKIEEIKPLSPIPEAPIPPPLVLPELPLKVSVPEPAPAFYVEAPKALEVEETKPLAPIPEAPVLPPFSAPTWVSYEPAPFYAPYEDSAYVPYPTGEFYVETPEAPKIEEIKPLSPIPEAPIPPPLVLPELPLKVSVPEPAPAFYIEAPKALEVEETKPLAPIPEAPVLPPFNAPVWVSYEPAPFYAPSEDGAYIVEAPETPKFEEIKPLAPIPEAPVLGPYTLPKLPLEVSVPEPAPVFIPYAEPKIEEEKTLAPIPDAPVLPPFIAPAEPIYYVEPAPIKCEEAEEIKPLASIPEAPVLPPFTFTLPEAPLKFDTAPAFIPPYDVGYFIDPTLIKEAKPLEPIPEAPVLGSYTLPELPLKVSVEEPVPCPPGVEPNPTLYISELPAPIENNEIIEAPKIEELKPIPAAPELPPLILAELPEIVIPEAPKAPEMKPIPAAPEFPSLDIRREPISIRVVTKVIEEPTKILFGGFEYPKWSSPELCAHTILKERVIPKFLEKEGSYKVVSIPAGSALPFNAYNPGFVAYIPQYQAPTYGLPVY